MHVAVAGGGIFGQVIAWRLALRGARVTLVEPVGPGSYGSGSGDRSRIVRALYDEPCFAEAGFVGLRLWDEWQRALGVPLVEKLGVLYLVRRDGPGAAAFHTWVARGAANVRALGGTVEDLSPADVSRRWPAVSVADLEGAAFEPAGGYGRAALATRTIARAAAATGRVTHVPARAVAIDEAAGAVRALRVRELPSVDGAPAEDRSIDADAIVVAAGLAGVDLIEPLCGRLPIDRLVHFTSYWDIPYPDGAALHQTQLPAWADLGAELYGFPDDGESGFKAASHAPRPRFLSTPPPPETPVNAAAPTPHNPYSTRSADAPTEAELSILRERVAVRFPAIRRARCRATYSCAYDSTSDERFQIGPVPTLRGLFFVGGMSGHGYKHAPSLGESVAAAVMGEPPLLDLSPYSLRLPT